MKHIKTITAILSLSLCVLVAAAFTGKPAGKYKNLQILPKDISEHDMDSIMQSYTVALGIGCSFCHDPMKNFPDSLDYVTDLNPMKTEARKMMRMTIEINKNHFYYNKSVKPEYLNVVHCKTCHRGEAYPE